MDSQRSGRARYTRIDSNGAIVSRLGELDKVPWYSKPKLRFLYLLMVPTCLGVEITSGFDAVMINGLQTVPSWLEYYHHPRSASLGLMAAMYPLGSFTAAPFIPFVVDKIGRKYSILLGGAVSIIGSILQGFSLNFTMFVLARFIIGAANTAGIVAASVLIGELSYPKERAVMTSIFNIFHFLGSMLAAAVTLGTFAMTSNWGWRIPSFLQVVPCLFQVAFVWFLPESPRWLVSKRRGNEAYAILATYHAEGDENSEFVKAEYSQIEETLRAELKIARMNQKEAFLTPGMRRRIIVATSLALFTHWSGAGLVAFYLSPVLDTIGIHDNRTKNLISLARASWNFLNGTLTALIVPRYSRRGVFLVCTVSVFLAISGWTIASADYSLTHNKVSAQVVLVFIFLFGLACNIGLGPLPRTYLVELFPFHVRTQGLAFFQWTGRGAAFMNQLANPIGMDLAGWKWYIIYCVWDAFQVVCVYFLFPETSGHTLEELTFLFEDEREALMQCEAEALLDHGDTGTGVLEDSPGRTARGVERE